MLHEPRVGARGTVMMMMMWKTAHNVTWYYGKIAFDTMDARKKHIKM